LDPSTGSHEVVFLPESFEIELGCRRSAMMGNI